MCCGSRGAFSRLGLIWGLLALAAVTVAYISGSWLYTKEPVTLPNSHVTTSISFKIGLWRVCPSVKRFANATIHTPSPACSLVKYSGWNELVHTDIGMWASLELAQPFISRMRSCTVLSGMSVIFLLLAVFFALLGHCNADNKTIIACGLFILSGLCLGTGLVVFVSTLSETLLEITQYHKTPSNGTPAYDYKYGWCFYTAGIAFMLTKLAAFFTLTGYLHRFPNMDEMVREMVPGAERKLREHQRLSAEYLVRHSCPPSRPYEPASTEHRPKYEPESGPLLNKTPPDVCTTNKCLAFPEAPSGAFGAADHFTATLAGQTVPITIKNHNSTAPLSFSNTGLSKYGTMPHGGAASSGSPHHVFHRGSEMCAASRSKTLQHQRPRKCVKIETFQTPESGFAELGGKRGCALGYSGSAV